MYISKELLSKAFYIFRNSCETPDAPKQGQTQYVSALRHFFAIDRLLKKNKTSTIKIKEINSDSYSDFVSFVADIVKIDESKKYAVNLIDSFKENADYGIGSNFISAGVVPRSLYAKQNYPKRNSKELLEVDNYTFSIHPNAYKNLKDNYYIQKINIAFFIWLNRYLKIPKEGNLYDHLKDDIESKYNKELAEILTPPKNEFTNFVKNIKQHQQQKANLSFLFNSKKSHKSKSHTSLTTKTPKAFLLLAGISGTGKSRFVKEQARASSGTLENSPDNYQLVAVRPDWHEPSDLLGYISRINDVKYIITDFLRFVLNAWQEIFDKGGNLQNIPETVRPFWLCLDEMNLAPVEQYFADYLSLIESRKWENNKYFCDNLLPNGDVLNLIKEAVDTEKDIDSRNIHIEQKTWDAFRTNKGIPIPPNLIVAGTVNMDETTHSFSRKVIDRALTIDFQEFFPNDFRCFLDHDKQNKPIPFSFPRLSQVDKQLYDTSNPELQKNIDESIGFLESVNSVLSQTPFQLAYRALNELLISVICFNPKNELELCAIWDDYLMQKVLPRIEGDQEKLRSPDSSQQESTTIVGSLGRGTILYDLYCLLESEHFSAIWSNKSRPDLLREGTPLIPCRSEKKLKWMMVKLQKNHFTDFWV